MKRYILAGWGFWLLLLAVYYTFRGSTHLAPRPVRHLAQVAMQIETVATWPVAAGGALLLDWQTGPQPAPWVTGKPFNVVVGLALYGALGLVVGAIHSRWRSRTRVNDSD